MVSIKGIPNPIIIFVKMKRIFPKPVKNLKGPTEHRPKSTHGPNSSLDFIYTAFRLDFRQIRTKKEIPTNKSIPMATYAEDAIFSM